MKKIKLFPELEAELKRQGYTHESIAKCIGLSTSSISYRMTGKVEWSLKEMKKVCSLLGKSLDQLFGTNAQ